MHTFRLEDGVGSGQVGVGLSVSYQKGFARLQVGQVVIGLMPS